MVLGSSVSPSGWMTTMISRPYFGKVEVPLVMRRYRHDRAGPVIVQDEVCDVDGHPEPCQGIDAVSAGEHPLLLVEIRSAGEGVNLQGTGHEIAYLPLLAGARRQSLDEGMLRSKAHERRSMESVWPGREHLDILRCTLDLEADQCAGAPADPVFLHVEHPLGPAVLQLFDIIQELLGIGGDPEEPLVVLLEKDLGSAPPALPLHDLLVGEHGLALVAPVEKGP